MITQPNTYDIVFNSEESSNNKGFEITEKKAREWIKQKHQGSYFEDYKGGTVSIICNQTQEVIYQEEII